MRSVLSILVVSLMLPLSSHAKNAYTQCGIGALIFSKTGWAAAISNIIWDLGTTATSSSSSTPSQCAGSGAKVGQLIYDNYASVEEETAVGQGEHLSAMLNILECDKSMHNAIITKVRADFLNSVQDSSYSQKSKLEKTEVMFNNVMDKANHKFASHCSPT